MRSGRRAPLFDCKGRGRQRPGRTHYGQRVYPAGAFRRAGHGGRSDFQTAGALSVRRERCDVSVCKRLCDDLSLRQPVCDDRAGHERLHQRAGVCGDRYAQRADRCRAEHPARSAVHLCVRLGRPRRRRGDGGVTGGLRGLGAAVSHRQADDSAAALPTDEAAMGDRPANSDAWADGLFHEADEFRRSGQLQCDLAGVRRRLVRRRDDGGQLRAGGADDAGQRAVERVGAVCQLQLRRRSLRPGAQRLPCDGGRMYYLFRLRMGSRG